MNGMKLVTKCLLGTMLLIMLAACAGSETSRSTGTYVDDNAITARVKTALIGNEKTKARQIQVETYQGVVQLSGFVDNQESKFIAERLAKDVEGVVGVKNDLIVK